MDRAGRAATPGRPGAPSGTAPTGLFRGGPQVTTVGRAFEAAA